jgi:hypothetical protein
LGNDTTIIATFVFFFVVLGGILPFVQSAFDEDTITTDVNKTRISLEEDIEELDSVNFLEVFFSIVTMFLWTFGGVPWFIDLAFFEPIRIVFYFILARYVRGGGG